MLHRDDGARTALGAESLALAGPLVVMSACGSALADAARGDESIGLVRSFLVAGASRVLGGLWAIDDEATARWMAAFHGELAQGRPPAQALAQVQRRFHAGGAHPLPWAPPLPHSGALKPPHQRRRVYPAPHRAPRNLRFPPPKPPNGTPS